MDERLYFAVGDLISNAAIAAIVAVLSWLIVSTDWNMFVAMLVMMCLGMAVSLPVALLFVAACGAMEVLVPMMLTSMVSGMVVGMLCAMVDLTLLEALLMGVATGVIGIAVIWILNNRLRGVQPLVGESEHG